MDILKFKQSESRNGTYFMTLTENAGYPDETNSHHVLNRERMQSIRDAIDDLLAGDYMELRTVTISTPEDDQLTALHRALVDSAKILYPRYKDEFFGLGEYEEQHPEDCMCTRVYYIRLDREHLTIDSYGLDRSDMAQEPYHNSRNFVFGISACQYMDEDTFVSEFSEIAENLEPEVLA